MLVVDRDTCTPVGLNEQNDHVMPDDPHRNESPQPRKRRLRLHAVRVDLGEAPRELANSGAGPASGQRDAADDTDQSSDAEYMEELALHASADDLARAGADPQLAIARLRAAAGEGASGTRRLRRATAMARPLGLQENAVAETTYRLLQAAAEGTPFGELTREELQQAQALTSFRALDDEQRWAMLVSREPALGALYESLPAGFTAAKACKRFPQRRLRPVSLPSARVGGGWASWLARRPSRPTRCCAQRRR